MNTMHPILKRISDIGIIPVVTIQDPNDALPLVNALSEGGIDAAEITFRSEHALTAMQIIHREMPNLLIGAGTVSSCAQAESAVNAGAAFIVTPGFNHEVVRWCIDHNVIVIPGVSTASEIETALSYGLTTLKFFPAESSGGVRKLKDFAAPYAQVRFIATGGIHEENMHDYLALPNILAIGGSFMLEKAQVTAKNWDAIRTRSQAAIAALLGYELIHIGIHHENEQAAQKSADTLCSLFHFTRYNKPKAYFAGKGFELLHHCGRGKLGHIAIYTPYPERAMYQLAKQGIGFIEESITRNKQTHQINFVYLDMELAGFGIHLINPDVKM